jgi:PST family polysaccharide transporter
LTIISVWILISVSGCAEIVGVLVLQPLVLLLVLQRMMRYPIKLTWSINLFELLRVSKKILFTGICLSAVNLIGNVASLVISIHIKRVGGEYVLGLFNAGQTIVVGCFSAIISAVTMDYYPTVASFRDDNARIGVALNNQTIIALRMINPALVCTVLYAPFLVRLLYSKDFLPAAQVVKYGVFGVAITVFSNQLDLILVAKGQNRSFFVIAIFYRISEIVICVFLFSVAGLTGLGIGMILTALMHLCLMYAFVVKVYKISYTKQVYRNMLITLLFVALSLIVVNSASGDFAIASGVLVVATSVLYSVRSLWSMLMAER